MYFFSAAESSSAGFKSTSEYSPALIGIIFLQVHHGKDVLESAVRIFHVNAFRASLRFLAVLKNQESVHIDIFPCPVLVLCGRQRNHICNVVLLHKNPDVRLPLIAGRLVVHFGAAAVKIFQIILVYRNEFEIFSQ